MSALRKAVAWCSGTDTAFTAQEVATIAGCEPATAATYLGRLVSVAVLVRDGEAYRAGPEAPAWRAKPVKTHEGGNSARYLAAKAVRDEIRAREWQEKRQSGRLTGQECSEVSECERECAIMNIDTMEALTESMTIGETASALGCHRQTVRRWIRERALKAIRVRRMIRVPKAEIEKLITAARED